jgi:hypothetical protein
VVQIYHAGTGMADEVDYTTCLLPFSAAIQRLAGHIEARITLYAINLWYFSIWLERQGPATMINFFPVESPPDSDSVVLYESESGTESVPARPSGGSTRKTNLSLSKYSTAPVPSSFWCPSDFLLSAGMVIIQPSTHHVLLVHDTKEKKWLFPTRSKFRGEELKLTALRGASEEVRILCDNLGA